MNKKVLLSLLVLLFATFACSALTDTMAATFETGSINFVVDQNISNKYHNDEAEQPVVPISIYSGFDTEKLANITIDGNSYPCLLNPKTVSSCPGIRLAKPGVYIITASVQKLNGDYVSTQINVEWMPYSFLDKLAQTLAGGEGKDPALGYAFGIALLVVISMILLAGMGAKLTGNSIQGLSIGATAGFFLSMILLAIAVYTNASPQLALTVVVSIVGIIIAAIMALVILNGIKHGSAVVIGAQMEHTGLDQKGNPIRTTGKVPFFAGPGVHSPQIPKPTDHTRQITGTRQQLLEAIDELDRHEK